MKTRHFALATEAATAKDTRARSALATASGPRYRSHLHPGSVSQAASESSWNGVVDVPHFESGAGDASGAAWCASHPFRRLAAGRVGCRGTAAPPL